MRNARWLVAVGLVAVTAGCAAPSGCPSSSYGYDRCSNAYSYDNPYYYGGRYYYRTSAYSTSATADHERDTNQDGIPDRLPR